MPTTTNCNFAFKYVCQSIPAQNLRTSMTLEMLLGVASNTMLTLQMLGTALYIVTMMPTAAALSTFRSENNVISTRSANQPWLKHQQNRSSASKEANPLVRSMIITMTLRAQEQLNQKWLIMSTAGRSAVSEAWNSVEHFECWFLSSLCLLLLEEEEKIVFRMPKTIYIFETGFEVVLWRRKSPFHRIIPNLEVFIWLLGSFLGISKVPFCF